MFHAHYAVISFLADVRENSAVIDLTRPRLVAPRVVAALEAAETGAEVVVVEREPYIGGRVIRSHNYFPKMCPPTCGMEMFLPIHVRR